LHIFDFAEIRGLLLCITTTLWLQFLAEGPSKLPKEEVEVPIVRAVLMLSLLAMLSFLSHGWMVNAVTSFRCDFYSHSRLVMAAYRKSVVVFQ
jgi:hypothetical protein